MRCLWCRTRQNLVYRGLLNLEFTRNLGLGHTARCQLQHPVALVSSDRLATPIFSLCASVGIDLGLKDFATLSNGEKIEAQRTYRQYQKKLGIAQRAKQKQRTRAIHAKIKNIRSDFLHKLSRQLVNDHAAIFVGNVNAKGLAQTKLAKSVLDASWTAFRT